MYNQTPLPYVLIILAYLMHMLIEKSSVFFFQKHMLPISYEEIQVASYVNITRAKPHIELHGFD